jgi:hypothetical protein
MSQIRKLAFNKTLVDDGQGGALAIWKLSPWKIFTIMITIAIGLTIIYAYYYTPDPRDFLGTLIFYAIVIALAIAIIFFTAGSMGKFRGIATGFLIVFILILVFYWTLGVILNYVHLLTFHNGYTLWIVISALAYMGAKRLDGDLDRRDVMFGFLVFLVLIGANIPINDTGGFLANLDNLIATILKSVPK